MHINNIRATAETIPTNEVTQESPQSIVAPESIQGEQVATVSVDTHSEQDVAENILSQSKGDKEIAIEAAKFDVRQAEKELKKLSSEVPKEIQSREEFIAYKLQKRGELAQLQERIQKLNSVVQLLEKETSDINDAQIEQPIDQKTELISEHEERQGRNLDEQPKSSDAVSSQVGPTDLDSDVQQPQGFRRIQEEDGQVPEFQRGDANTQTGEQPLKDKQGNAIDSEGRLVVDEIAHMSELTDEDFTTPTRSVLLPPIPKNVDEAIGANGKRVIIKKNILDKNNKTHRFTPEQSRSILSNALYNPNVIGQTQPRERANHWVAIKIDEKSPITILEVNSTKDNVEVVGWYTLDKRNLDRIKRQAEREGGELLILTPNDRVESLSTPTSDLSSTSEGTKEKEYNKDATAADVITDQVSKEINKRQKQYQRLVDQLRKTGLALDVIDSQEAYDKKLKEVAENRGTTFRDLKGRVYGFANNETVYIDPSKMDLNTPIHEFTHLWYSAMKSKDPELVKRGLELVKRTKYYREVKNSSEYQGLSEEQILDEALAHALGDLGEKQVAKKGVIRTKLGLWVKEFFDKLRSLFGVESDVDMYDFADMVLSDLLSGKSIGSAKENGTRFRMSDEQEQIKQQALANGSFMKAPNGEPSNLNEHQWTQVRTKAFKDWFGDWEKKANFETLKQKINGRKQQEPAEYSDEFRGVQERSRGLSEDEISRYHRRRQEADGEDAGLRKLLHLAFTRQLSAQRIRGGNDIRSVVDKYGNRFNIIEDINGQLFHDIFEIVRNYLKNGELVDLHDNYDNCVCYITEDGLSGFAVEENGNLVSVFNLNKDISFLGSIKDYVSECGATHLDGYNSKNQPLAEIYKKTLGWQVASMMDYNMEYDHDNIAENHGSPQVAFMVNSSKDIPQKAFDKDSYDAAEAYQLEQREDALNDFSKMVDENGEPNVFYHRSNAEFSIFDSDKNGSNTDAGWLGDGFYFYGDISEAYGYGDKQYDVFLNIRNPYYASSEEHEDLAEKDDRGASVEFREMVESEGHDGVYYNGDLRQETVVFSPTQIKSATENVGTFDQGNPDIRFRIGERRKADMRAGLLNKLTNATEEQVERTIAEIEKLGESTKEGGNPKLEKVAFHWAKKGTIILPEDNDKVIHAVKLSESFKVDPIKYDNPMEIINEYSPDVEYGEPVDPDSIPEFTNKREIGSTGVFVYDVEESEKAQEAVCKIAHAQFGWDPKANLSKQPWCLASFTRKGIPTESAKNFWANTYNSVGKKIAFQDEKVIAFMAHNKGRDVDVWWNLTDDPSYNLPLPSGDYINPDGEIEPEREASSNSDGMEEAIELVAQEISDDDFARILVELYENDQLNNTREIELTAQDKLGEYISENIESFNYELEDYEEEYREERGIDPEDDIDRSEMIERFIESVDAKYGYRPLEFFDDDSVREDFIRQVADSVVSNMNKDERIAVLSDYLDYADGSSEYEQAIQEYQDQRRDSNSLRFRANLRNEINLNPSDRQKEAGNYKKAHIRVDGFDVSIETPKGGIRSGVDENGVPWSATMQNDYGYIRGTKGKDGDHIDIFLGNLSTGSVFVVDQVKEDGSFDEHKVMYGFGSKEEAEAAYLSSYSPGWKGLGNITEVSKEDFKEWVKSSKRKTKPFAEYKKYGNNAILQQVNDRFNKDIKELTEENARGKILELGNPSDVLLSAGISDRPIKLYGSKLLAKARKHGFKFGDVANLPIAVANPVAVFDGSERGSFAILTELLIGGRNVLASLSVGRNNDVDFNLVRSVYGKNKRGVIDWILNGKMRYANKEKALDYLRISAPIAEAQDNQELSSATKIIEEFENPSIENGPVRFRADNRSLVAVHNLSEDNLRKAVELGGFPMPSIAITDVGVGHSKFGEISLIFDKSSINPSDRRNKVYSGDGWTPMFPSVNFKINESVSKKIRNDVEALLHDYNYIDEYRLHLDDYNIDDSVNRSGSFSEAYKSNVAMKIAYIKHIGIPFKPVLKKKEYSSTVDNDTLKKITKEVGNGDATALMNLGIDEKMALEPTIRGIVSSSFEQKLSNIDHESKLFSYLKEQANKELSFSEVDNILYSAYLYQKDGDKVIIDNAKTRERVEKKFTKKMNEGYDEWLNNLSNGIIEKRGIRNNVDPFTRSGYRRSWNALFDEVTLDNVVKAMMSKSEKGGDGFFGGSIFGAAQSRITSIDDIRDFAKSHIKEVSDEEMSAARKEITDRLSKIQIQGVGDGIGDVLDLSENIVEAVKRSHDAKGLYKYLKHYYPGITLEVSEEIADIVKDIKNLSTRYLEAKPMRAVGFREVKAAVVPKGIDESLVDILQANGIDVVEYKKGDEAARRRAISKVTKENELRFRASNEETAYDTAFGKSIKESKAARIAKKFSVPISTKVVSRFDLPKEQQKKAVIYDNGSLSVVMENVRDGELERAILEEVLPKQGLSALASIEALYKNGANLS